MTKCVATAVEKNSESFRMSGDTDWSLSFIGPVRFLGAPLHKDRDNSSAMPGKLLQLVLTVLRYADQFH